MTWNIEGLRRNIYNLKHFLGIYKPDIIFLSEPQIFAHDVDLVMKYLCGEYCYSLNSADNYDQELPFTKSRAHGGTMVLWKSCHDPYISPYPVSTSSFLPILFHPPRSPLSIHISVYLPTLGQESQFMEEMSNLSCTIDELRERHPNAPIFLRGDFNVNSKVKSRNNLLDYFTDEQNLSMLQISHPTYHHFLGEGASDSFLDKIMFPKSLPHSDVLTSIICKLTDPLVDSHHDIILSSWTLVDEIPNDDCHENLVAPRVPNLRHKVIWTDAGVEAFQDMVLPHLARLQDLWLCSPSKTSCSLLLESTNSVLTKCASLTNKTVSLAHHLEPKSACTPRPVKISGNKLLRKAKRLKNLTSQYGCDSEDIKNLRIDYKKSRMMHRKLSRQFKAKDACVRDQNLLSNPAATFSRIRASKRGKLGKINKLKVDDKTYVAEAVPDGFFDAISELKARDTESLKRSNHFQDFSRDFSHILEICKAGASIPVISLEDSHKLLQRMKPSVNDFYSVTPNHYNYAGPAGWNHFHLLLNSLITDVNNTTIEEINTVYACILFKGHGKDKSSSRSYRTISTCPVVAKALDLHLRDMHIDSWNKDQSETQFQGEGSSHELASLLLTECIQHSLYTLNEPLFVLYLDAKSAFDVVLCELLIKNLFAINNKGDQSLLYLNNRLENRQTFIDWDGQLMGPIYDEQGVEQGGINSSDLYKVFGKEQLELAQKSSLGVSLGNLTISGIGQADDTALLTNSIQKLFYLLELTKIFCSKYQVELCAEKTKLQAFSTKSTSFSVTLSMAANPIKINGDDIKLSSTAEHVGLLRCTSGNGPAILERFTAHRKALRGVLQTGMAKGHRGNPAHSLQIDQMYAIPVLMSGLGSLVLSEQEINLIDMHHKETLRCLLRLQQNTPRSVIYFMAGCLPGSALLHLRQLSLFGMITRLQGSLLNQHASNISSYTTISNKSWFHQIRKWCLLYGLPHPQELLSSPLSKPGFKTLVKKKVICYWETLLRTEAQPKPSLEYFKPSFMSLTSSHPMFTTAGSSPAKVSMALVQSVMLSGRYRTEALCSHWSRNKAGVCLLSESCSNTVETVKHILVDCPALEVFRTKMASYTANHVTEKVPAEVGAILHQLCSRNNPQLCHILLDCSSIPEVISAVQLYGKEVLDYFYEVTRTWIYVLHRERLKMMGRWNPSY